MRRRDVLRLIGREDEMTHRGIRVKFQFKVCFIQPTFPPYVADGISHEMRHGIDKRPKRSDLCCRAALS